MRPWFLKKWWMVTGGLDGDMGKQSRVRSSSYLVQTFADRSIIVVGGYERRDLR